MENPGWESYREWSAGRQPYAVFSQALARFKAESVPAFQWHAIGLGCGDCTETLALLEAGWRVLAIDREPVSIAHVRSKVRVELRPQLETRQASFEGLELPATDFVHAGFSLPFCRPEYFDLLWATITACIRPGGRFAGQLFGIRDSWVGNTEMTFHSAAQVKELLARRFEVETLQETDQDGQALTGPKHWHFFAILARKFG